MIKKPEPTAADVRRFLREVAETLRALNMDFVHTVGVPPPVEVGGLSSGTTVFTSYNFDRQSSAAIRAQAFVAKACAAAIAHGLSPVVEVDTEDPEIIRLLFEQGGCVAAEPIQEEL